MNKTLSFYDKNNDHICSFVPNTSNYLLQDGSLTQAEVLELVNKYNLSVITIPSEAVSFKIN